MSQFHPPPALVELLQRVSARALPVETYIVGGAVRDALLGVPAHDLDLAVAGAARERARGLADALGGHFVALDDERDVARIVLDAGDVRQIDVAALPDGIDADLCRRDYTIDAMAVRLSDDAIIDPCGGLADLDARLVRMTSASALDADPLRLVRGIRIAAELGFTLEAATAAAIRARAAAVLASAPERRRDELCRIFALERAATGLLLLDEAGLLDVLLPEVALGKGVEQPQEHAYDVFEHNMRTVAALDVMLAAERPAADAQWMWEMVWEVFGWCEARLRAYFAEEMSEGRTRAGLLRWAGLLHDVAKPQTRARQPDGRIRFFGHAEEGARVAGSVLRRFRFSARERRWVALLVGEHLRPVQLAQLGEAPTRRALHRFFKDLGDAAAAVLFLSLADAAAARGPEMTPEGWRRQAAYMNSLIVRSFEDEGIVQPPRLLTGYDIMSELGLTEGPLVGRLLGVLEEAQAAGDVRDREEALAFIRQQERAGPDRAGQGG
ncbi:MAG: HD domain-containing protein [Dehalococcoidia bacterium]|nr:HD domain-containing protein [Dehalococcoidia bacterium]